MEHSTVGWAYGGVLRSSVFPIVATLGRKIERPRVCDIYHPYDLRDHVLLVRLLLHVNVIVWCCGWSSALIVSPIVGVETLRVWYLGTTLSAQGDEITYKPRRVRSTWISGVSNYSFVEWHAYKIPISHLWKSIFKESGIEYGWQPLLFHPSGGEM